MSADFEKIKKIVMHIQNVQAMKQAALVVVVGSFSTPKDIFK